MRSGHAYVINHSRLQALFFKSLILKEKAPCRILSQKPKSLTDQGLWENSSHLFTKLSTVYVRKAGGGRAKFVAAGCPNYGQAKFSQWNQGTCQVSSTLRTILSTNNV
jgi:hypothetical protein